MALPTDGSQDGLEAIFAQYREACPEPEMSSSFTPGMWRKIDARRGFSLRIGRLSRRFVTAAAALCLLMVILLTVPQSPSAGMYSTSYLEALTTDHSTEDLPFTELEHREGEVE
ncbi:MAG: hypothetical protein NTY38_12030 [Acidobacteria bacterium]|nr:hypothetical protein [Acidobacteriota bacterium]